MKQNHGAIGSLITAAALAMMLNISGLAQAAGTDTMVKRGQSAPKMLNPQPEVPSKPQPGDGMGPTQGQVLSPRPDGVVNPKALNPQPEVPSKPYKKTLKKKPGPKPPPQ